MIPLRVYRAVCLVGAAVGLAVAAYFFVTGPVDVGWVLLVLTVLLWPAYLAYAWAVRRRG